MLPDSKKSEREASPLTTTSSPFTRVSDERHDVTQAAGGGHLAGQADNCPVVVVARAVFADVA
jgi:hypothetical protein